MYKTAAAMPNLYCILFDSLRLHLYFLRDGGFLISIVCFAELVPGQMPNAEALSGRPQARPGDTPRTHLDGPVNHATAHSQNPVPAFMRALLPQVLIILTLAVF